MINIKEHIYIELSSPLLVTSLSLFCECILSIITRSCSVIPRSNRVTLWYYNSLLWCWECIRKIKIHKENIQWLILFANAIAAQDYDSVTNVMWYNVLYVRRRSRDNMIWCFIRDYVSSNRPVKLLNAISHWTAHSRWTGDYLIEKIGDDDVSVAITPNGESCATTAA